MVVEGEDKKAPILLNYIEHVEHDIPIFPKHLTKEVKSISHKYINHFLEEMVIRQSDKCIPLLWILDMEEVNVKFLEDDVKI